MAEARRAWAEAAPRLDPVRLVLLDETWATTSPLRRGRQGAGGGADAGGAAHRDAARLRPHPGGGRAGRRARPLRRRRDQTVRRRGVGRQARPATHHPRPRRRGAPAASCQRRSDIRQRGGARAGHREEMFSTGQCRTFDLPTRFTPQYLNDRKNLGRVRELAASAKVRVFGPIRRSTAFNTETAEDAPAESIRPDARAISLCNPIGEALLHGSQQAARRVRAYPQPH